MRNRLPTDREMMRGDPNRLRLRAQHRLIPAQRLEPGRSMADGVPSPAASSPRTRDRIHLPKPGRACRSNAPTPPWSCFLSVDRQLLLPLGSVDLCACAPSDASMRTRQGLSASIHSDRDSIVRHPCSPANGRFLPQLTVLPGRAPPSTLPDVRFPAGSGSGLIEGLPPGQPRRRRTAAPPTTERGTRRTPRSRYLPRASRSSWLRERTDHPPVSDRPSPGSSHGRQPRCGSRGELFLRAPNWLSPVAIPRPRVARPVRRAAKPNFQAHDTRWLQADLEVGGVDLSPRESFAGRSNA